jgi:hypothetical protein
MSSGAEMAASAAARVLVAPEAVVEDRGCPVRGRRRDALPHVLGLLDRPLDQAYSFGLPAAHRQGQRLRRRREARAGRFADRASLRHVRRGGGEVAAAGGRIAEGEHDRGHLTQGAGVARDLDLTGAHRANAVVVPEGVAGRRRVEAPAKAFVDGHIVSGEGARGAEQRRSRGGAAVREQQRDAVEQRVHGTRRSRRTWQRSGDAAWAVRVTRT